MTHTPPARALRPRRLRRIVAAISAALIAVGVAIPAHAATPPAEPGGAVLTLSPVGSGILRPGSALSVSATVENATASDLPASLVTLELGAAALPDRQALSSWLTDARAAAPGPVVGTAAIEAVRSGADATAGIIVAPEEPVLAGRAPGVYPLRATASVGGDTLVSTSVVVVPDDTVATPVGVVVPIAAAPQEAGLLSAEELAPLTAADGELTAQLDAVDGTEAILAVDPAVVAAIRVLGTAAPTTAAEWLARLESLPNTRFPLQFGDADLATQVHAGLTPPLQPTSLTSYITPGNIAASPSPTPTPGADPAVPVLPDLAELTTVGPHAAAGMYWPGTGTAGADVVAALGSAGVDGAPSLTLIPSATTAGGQGDRTARARGAAGDAQLLIYDSAISDALRRAADQPDTSLRGAALTEATAHLAFATRESGGQPLLVTVDRGTDRERVSLRTAIVAASAPGTSPTGLPPLLAADVAPVTVDELAPDEAAVADLQQLLSDEATVAQFATVLDDPALLTGRERAEILQLLAVGWRADSAARAAAMVTHREQTAATLDSVGILPSSTLNLISYDATFAPWVRNDLPYPVRVTLVARPDAPQLVVAERTEVLAPADSNTRAAIPVQARIGNGAVTVTMQLYSPAGVAVGAVQSAEVEVRAEWETIGLVILIVLMVLFVGLGIFRTVVRRRARRPAPEQDADVGTDTPPGGGG
ncbi:DUF6049 family protein [Microbacterium sp. RD1]|uniref:DUF6049 family protein n=1 Tax=Microbacterium sp. RD1 TaxID=3457313 RepID=UPI003FA5A776